MKEREDIDFDRIGYEVQKPFYHYTITRDHNNIFYGDKHNTQELTADSGTISVDRQGGFTTVILSMLLEKDNGKPKYTIDQLFDTNQFQKEKQDRFDEIVKRSRKLKNEKNNEDEKWVAETLYNGMKLMNDIIDEEAEKIDVTNPDFIYSKEFARVAGLASIVFDAWQEINRFPEMMQEVVKADRPELTDEAAVRGAVDSLTNPVATTYGYVKKMFEVHNSIQAGDTDFNVSPYLGYAVHMKYMEQVMRDFKKSGKKFSQFMADNDISNKIMFHRSAANDKLFEMRDNFATADSKFTVMVDKRIMDGSLFKNLEYDAAKNEFKNFPKVNTDNTDFVFEETVLKNKAPQEKQKTVEKKAASKKKEVKKASSKKEVKKTAPKKEVKEAAPKKAEPTITTLRGENIPVNEVLDYLQALKQTAGEARGIFHDSEEYTAFYMAIDDVAKAARGLKKNKSENIINKDNDKLKDYKEAVNRLKECAEAYEAYKMKDHTRDKSKEPDKKELNSDDKRKLKIMRSVLHNNRYFNVEAPYKKLTNEQFLVKTDEALVRLKKGGYKNTKKYIEDSAYAVFGQMYRFNGSRELLSKEGEPIELQKIMQEKIASGEFVQTLVSKSDPKKLIAPSKVANMAENEEQMKEVVKAVSKERTSINNNALKKTTGTNKNNVNNGMKRRNSTL